MKQEDYMLCRGYLQEASSIEVSERDFQKKNLWWFRICGITDFAKKYEDEQYRELFQNILSGLMIPSCEVGLIITGTQQGGISFYLGITDDDELLSMVKGSLLSSIPGIDISDNVPFNEIPICRSFAGVTVGVPNISDNAADGKSCISRMLPIDRLCRSMMGTNFSIMLLAVRKPQELTNLAMMQIDSMLVDNSSRINAQRTNELGQSVSYTNEEARQYQEHLQRVQRIIYDGFGCGLWNVSLYYSAETNGDLLRVKNSILSNYMGNTLGRLEKLTCIDFDYSYNLFRDNIAEFVKENDSHRAYPLYSVGGGYEFNRYAYQTVMSSSELSRFFMLPKIEFHGFYIDSYVEFDSVMRNVTGSSRLRIGVVVPPGRSTNGIFGSDYEIPLNDLSRHALIIGITGGGKTNTMKAILQDIWCRNEVPFLVIESAKREYIELANSRIRNSFTRNFEDLKVFTLGNETSNGVRYRINPFEVLPGISLQTHIDYLLSTFNASFEMYAPMPQILERAVYEVYEDKGWDLYSGENKRGFNDYPTLEQLYYKIPSVMDGLGYAEEVQSNVKAALQTRINSLRIGGKGALLDVPKSIPISWLLDNPAVFELEDIGDDDTKAFVIGILLVQLYEYRKSCGSSQKLKGVLIIEEAHRLLKNVSAGEGNNSRAKAVEFFCNMLAEIRSFGQGIIIADQIPTKLANDTIKNTNLKIVHRTVMEEDRNCIGAAMYMTDEQIDYLSSLQRGCAAVYAEGDNRPKLVRMPLISNTGTKTREEILQQINNSLTREFAGIFSERKKLSKACVFCEKAHCPNKEIVDRLKEFDPKKSIPSPLWDGIELENLKDICQLFCASQGISLESDEMEACMIGMIHNYFEQDDDLCVQMIRNYWMDKRPWRDDR